MDIEIAWIRNQLRIEMFCLFNFHFSVELTAGIRIGSGAR